MPVIYLSLALSYKSDSLELDADLGRAWPQGMAGQGQWIGRKADGCACGLLRAGEGLCSLTHCAWISGFRAYMPRSEGQRLQSLHNSLTCSEVTSPLAAKVTEKRANSVSNAIERAIWLEPQQARGE